MKTLLSYICVLALGATAAFGQDQKGDGATITLPKEQYQRLLDEHQKLLEEMKEIKAFKAKMEEAMKKVAPQQAETEQALNDFEKELKDVKKMAKDAYPGTTKMLLSGYGSAGFTSHNPETGNRGFSATFNPIFLWKMSDRLLFESELEAQLGGTDTHIGLEIAQISYVLNDYITLGAGKFLNPVNYFVERQHMAWVNKLPDKPLAVYDGLLPESNVGLQLRGGIPLGSTKLGYAIYAANAPLLTASTNSAVTDFGKVQGDNFDNLGKHIAYGGRVGFLPIPEFEVGYGVQYSDVSPFDHAGRVRSFLHSADMSYVRDSAALLGILNLKAQWIWSQVGSFTYDPTAAVGGPYNFKNYREGGYAQVAYRPTRVANSFMKDVEPVFRYDLLKQGNTPASVDEYRYTFGLNYWFGPSTVLKAAYEIDHQKGINAAPHDAFLFQFATGF